MGESLVCYYRAMARNNAWSNHRLLGACATLTQAEFEASRVSFFPSLTLTLQHILFVDRYYIDALEGRPRAYSEDAAVATAAELRGAQSASDRRLIAVCDRLDADALTRPVRLVRDADRIVEDGTQRVLAHLFTHQIHHRGQAHAMLAGTSVAPPQLDEFLLGSDAPLRSADLAALGFGEAETWPGGTGKQ